MDETSNLKLPFIMAAQSQKHVTHNEALRALDAIVQLAVVDRIHTSPPVTATEGVRYIVAAPATGAWAGQEDRIAAMQDGAWVFYAPTQGWLAFSMSELSLLVWDGTQWAAATAELQNIALLGIHAIADTTNRLAVAAPATLLSHDGAGHQLKINKASAAATAVILLQDGFSGRAEIGLAGDDNFHLKVSADGSNWKEALVIDRASGAVNMPFSSNLAAPVTITAGTGNESFFEKLDAAAMRAIAPLFTTAIAAFEDTNAAVPLTDAFGQARFATNMVWTQGWNFHSGGGRLDTTKPAFGMSYEHNYFINTSAGWRRGMEFHVKAQSASTGLEHRPITGWFPWDDSGVGSMLGFNVDNFVFGRYDTSLADYARVQMDFSQTNFTKVQFNQRTEVDFFINAQPIIRQRNGAGTDFIALPYINAANALNVPTPMSVNATYVDVNGAIMTLGLASATLASGQYGVFMSANAAAGASVNPWKSSINSTGTVDFTSWNLGGGHSYLSAWVAVGNGDAATVYNVNGGGIWTAGLDNSDDDAYVVSQNNGLGSNNAMRLDRTTLRHDFGGPARLKSYTVAGLPSASTAGAGALVYVSNASGGPTLACSDGTNWKVVAALGATVS